MDIGIIWEDVVLMDEVLPEAALSDLSAEVTPQLFSVALLFAMMSRTIYKFTTRPFRLPRSLLSNLLQGRFLIFNRIYQVRYFLISTGFRIS